MSVKLYNSGQNGISDSESPKKTHGIPGSYYMGINSIPQMKIDDEEAKSTFFYIGLGKKLTDIKE